MRTVFVDRSFYIAAASARDADHAAANKLMDHWRGHMVTTEYVLAELGNWLSHGIHRAQFTAIVDHVRANPQTAVVPADRMLFDAALQLFRERPDKEWSFTDCTSFVVMRRQMLLEALTTDHHFVQAGFRSLLSERA